MKLIKPLDILLVIFTLLLSLLLFILFFSGEADGDKTAVIRLNGQTVQEIELSSVSAPYDIEIGGNCKVVLTVYGDGVEFKYSQCRDQICVNTGKITSTGASAVCLPGKVSVEIINSSEASADAVVW